MRRLSALLGGLLLPAIAASAVVGEWRVTLLRGSSTSATVTGPTEAQTWDRCYQRIAAQAPSTTQWTCQTMRFVARVVADPPPPPVDCVVSAWSDWTGGEWQPAQCPAEGQQTRLETRTRTIITPAANGGQACPTDLSETRTAVQTCTPPPPPPPVGGGGQVIFFDDFGYDVPANASGDAKRAAFQAAGWNGLKDETTQPGRARGYLSTVATADTPCGPLPIARALKMDGRPSMGVGSAPPYQNQTDFYLSRGTPGAVGRTDPPPTIPGRVYFQAWICVDQSSHWAARNKLVYPSDDGTATGGGTENSFMIHIRPSNQAGLSQGYGPNFYAVTHLEGASIVSTAPEGAGRVGHNLTNAGAQLAGTWYLHKWHFDHSREHGTYEHWIRPQGGAWLKTSEWISGVTPGFTWITHANQRVGHNLFKLGTTWGTAQTDDPRDYDATIFLTHFAVAAREEDLPVYPNF